MYKGCPKVFSRFVVKGIQNMYTYYTNSLSNRSIYSPQTFCTVPISGSLSIPFAYSCNSGGVTFTRFTARFKSLKSLISSHVETISSLRIANSRLVPGQDYTVGEEIFEHQTRNGLICFAADMRLRIVMLQEFHESLSLNHFSQFFKFAFVVVIVNGGSLRKPVN